MLAKCEVHCIGVTLASGEISSYLYRDQFLGKFLNSSPLMFIFTFPQSLGPSATKASIPGPPPCSWLARSCGVVFILLHRQGGQVGSGRGGQGAWEAGEVEESTADSKVTGMASCNAFTPRQTLRRRGGRGSRVRRMLAYQLMLTVKRGLPLSRLLSNQKTDARFSKAELQSKELSLHCHPWRWRRRWW